MEFKPTFPSALPGGFVGSYEKRENPQGNYGFLIPGDELAFVGGGALNGAVGRLLLVEGGQPIQFEHLGGGKFLEEHDPLVGRAVPKFKQDTCPYARTHMATFKQATQQLNQLIKAVPAELAAAGDIPETPVLASFARVNVPGDHAFGAVFINIFKEDMQPFKGSKNVALVYTVGALGRNKRAEGEEAPSAEREALVKKTKKDFLEAIFLTGQNIMAAVVAYNQTEDVQTEKLPRIDILRSPIVAGGTFIHPDATPEDVALALLDGYKDQHDCQHSPHLELMPGKDMAAALAACERGENWQARLTGVEAPAPDAASAGQGGQPGPSQQAAPAPAAQPERRSRRIWKCLLQILERRPQLATGAPKPHQEAGVVHQLAAPAAQAKEKIRKMRLIPANYWGISGRQLMELADEVEKHFTGDGANPTVYAVVDKLIKPLCKPSGVSYAVLKNPKGLKCTTFVTHAWAEFFLEFVDDIQRHCENFETTVFWICFTANPQTWSPEDLGDLLFPPLQSPFVIAMQQCTTFLIVRNGTKNMYSRLWCVAELVLANAWTDSRMQVIGRMPARAQASGQDVGLNAKCNPADVEMLRATIRQTGLDVNELVANAVRAPSGSELFRALRAQQ